MLKSAVTGQRYFSASHHKISAFMVRADLSAQVFVWGVWLIMMIADLFILAKLGRIFPLNEDWWLVAPMTGNQPNLFEWFWVQNSEHSIPFPRLILMALLKLSHGDFRAGMLFNISIIGALAGALIWAARAIRGGRTRFADAFFPIALLHIGNAENLLWCWQLTQVVPTVLTCVMLLILLSNQTFTTPATAIVGGTTLALLPLSGSHALLFAPSLSLWFGYWGLRGWRAATTAGRPRWIGGFWIGSAIVSLSCTGLYVLRYTRPSWRPPDPTIAQALETAAKFLAISFGPAVRSSWAVAVVALLGVLLAGASVAALAVLRRGDQERYRALGLLIFFANIALLALATGWGRATAIQSVYGQYPLRYVLMAAPALLAAFFAWDLYGPTKLRAALPAGLFVVTCLLLPLNTLHGLNWLYWFPDRDQALERDLIAGNSAEVLAERYQGLLLHWVEPSEIAGYMRMLRAAGIGPFSHMTAVSAKSVDATPTGSPAPSRPVAQSVATNTAAAWAIQELRYSLPEAERLELVWGINGWLPAPPELLPAGTVIKDNLMHTPMVRVGDAFAVKIRVPSGTRLDYGFLALRKQSFADLIWPMLPAWDWNGDQGYRMIVSHDGVTETHASQAMAGYLFSIDFGRSLLFAIGALFGVSLAVTRIVQMIGMASR